MPLDIYDFRAEKGGDVAKLKASQAARGKDGSTIDEIIEIDQKWRKTMFKCDQMRKELGLASKQIKELKKSKGDCTEVLATIATTKAELKTTQVEVEEIKRVLDKKIGHIGNYVRPDVPVSNDEKDNKVVAEFGPRERTGNELHHHELLHMIGGYDSKRGVNVAGHRGYYLTGPGVLLNQALINYALGYLMKNQYTPIQPPFFMKKEIMEETAQLEEFDEALYHVSTGHTDDDAYLIATSEQPISAFHRGEWLHPEELPKKYAGISTCFRKEAGSHGKDAWGIFRVHQFEKIEQFVVCDPEKSDEMLETMIKIAQDFYESLGLSYHVVTVVSGELNNAAAKKYDLEAWFPALGVMRELVSASNCTDYQSRAMETRFGQKKMGDREKTYVHMLNATLCATTRTMCCILENYQTENGVKIPEVLQPFMGGMDFMPFVNEKPINVNKVNMQKKAAKKAKETN